MMMPEMAFVTLISGVCSAGVTFHTTCQPTKQASTNTVKWARNAGGVFAVTCNSFENSFTSFSSGCLPSRLVR